jgi:hypothetical protein
VVLARGGLPLFVENKVASFATPGHAGIERNHFHAFALASIFPCDSLTQS